MITIRKADRNDFDSIRSLRSQLHKMHCQARPDIYRDCDPLTAPEYKEMLKNKGKVVLVAVDSDTGEVVGFADASLKRVKGRSELCDRCTMYIDAVGVDERRRSQGIGKKLFEAVKQLAKKSGAQSLELMVWEFNRSAFDFYTKEGMNVRSMTLEEKL